MTSRRINRLRILKPATTAPLLRISLDGGCPCGCDRRDGATGNYVTISKGDALWSVELTDADVKVLLRDRSLSKEGTIRVIEEAAQ